jgi:hypothetical protein
MPFICFIIGNNYYIFAYTVTITALYFDALTTHAYTYVPTHAYTYVLYLGLMGNPSDGFRGKTLSFLLDNFAVTVTLTELSDGLNRPKVELVPNPVLDPSSFGGLDKLQFHTICKVITVLYSEQL